jgi:thioredoxin-related protein
MIKHYLILIALLVTTNLSLAEPPSTTTNWADTAATARKDHTLIMVVFESQNCSYCSRLKREVLETLTESSTRPPPLIKEFDIYSGGKIIDFNGDSIRSRQFKKRYEIFAVPTLFILDSDGKPLADPIVGYNSQQEYLELLRSSLIASYDALN